MTAQACPDPRKLIGRYSFEADTNDKSNYQNHLTNGNAIYAAGVMGKSLYIKEKTNCMFLTNLILNSEITDSVRFSILFEVLSHATIKTICFFAKLRDNGQSTIYSLVSTIFRHRSS